MKLPTMKINNPNEDGGFIIINESDFDADTMTAYDEAPADNPSKMKVAELKAALDAQDIDYDDDDKKADLIARLDNAQSGD